MAEFLNKILYKFNCILLILFKNCKNSVYAYMPKASDVLTYYLFNILCIYGLFQTRKVFFVIRLSEVIPQILDFTI